MTKLNYVRPTMIVHGQMVELTKGPCVCKTEDDDTFKPVED